MLLEGWVIGCMAFRALLCSNNASSLEQRSALRAIDPSPPHKKHIRLLGGSSTINPTRRRGTQGLLWASRVLFSPAAVMVGLVVALGTAVPSPPNPSRKKTKIFFFRASLLNITPNGRPDFGHEKGIILWEEIRNASLSDSVFFSL